MRRKEQTLRKDFVEKTRKDGREMERQKQGRWKLREKNSHGEGERYGKEQKEGGRGSRTEERKNTPRNTR